VRFFPENGRFLDDFWAKDLHNSEKSSNFAG
jgi:hypothetical protein